MIENLHHIGFATCDLDGAIAHFESIFGATVLWRSQFADQQFESALISLGTVRIELLASLAPGSMIDSFIENKGEGLHHISLEVNDFDDVISDFKAKGLKVIGQTDMENFKAAFIHPKSMLGMLTEIIAPKGSWGR